MSMALKWGMQSDFELVVRVITHGKPAIEGRIGFVADMNDRIDGSAKTRLRPAGIDGK